MRISVPGPSLPPLSTVIPSSLWRWPAHLWARTRLFNTSSSSSSGTSQGARVSTKKKKLTGAPQKSSIETPRTVEDPVPKNSKTTNSMQAATFVSTKKSSVETPHTICMAFLLLLFFRNRVLGLLREREREREKFYWQSQSD